MNAPVSLALGAICGIVLTSALFLLIPGCGTPVQGRTFDPAAPTFPTVTGESLNKRVIAIPADLDAPFNLLLVAFRQRQQSEVDTWIPTARQIIAGHANVEYYELPTISGSWGPVRGWIDGGMRGGIPDFGARERTVTVYTDTSKFRELAGIDSPERIWVGLVDRQGRVYWSARGPASEEMLTELREAVRSTASPAAPRPGAR